QAEVKIEVYQGESPDVRQNSLVGDFMIQGLARVPAGNPILVQFELNPDGLLRATARERATGLSKQVTMENALARFQRQERDRARQRLEEVWGEEGADGEDELEGGEEAPGALPELVPGPREGQREAVQARALLEKAERLLTKVAAEDRPDVERQMERVRAA